jgi:hypothetical protein
LRNISNNPLVDELASQFFCITTPTQQFAIINMAQIINKATFLLNEEEVFFALCNDLVEHDMIKFYVLKVLIENFLIFVKVFCLLFDLIK